MIDVIVIGGGPAGMLAAISSSRAGGKVLLLEKNEKLGKKLFITGKGRCNVTNSADEDEIIKNIVSNPRFMYSSLKAYSNKDICADIEAEGIKLKEERGGRIFPVSDHSSDVIKALSKMLEKSGAKVWLRSEVTSVRKTDEGFDVLIKGRGKEQCRALIIATGGLSYQSTGSTGDGLKLAESLGIGSIPCTPALVPLVTVEKWCSELQGLSLKNTGLKLILGKKTVYEDFGEMLFTHFGISGPMVLSASCFLDPAKYSDYEISLDLKPALSIDELDDRLLREIEGSRGKHFINMLPELLPSKMVPVIAGMSGVDPHKKCGDIKKEERKALAGLLKDLKVHIQETRGFEEAIITKGGISVKEISPKDMMSKKNPGLFFAGEVLDLDAKTGGYNLQIAWSTGHAAGVGSAEYINILKGEKL